MDRLLHQLTKPKVGYCSHIQNDEEIFLYFTGINRDHILVCSDCKILSIDEIISNITSTSFKEIMESGFPNPWQLDGIIGEPSITSKIGTFSFVSNLITGDQTEHLRPIAIKGIPNNPKLLLVVYVHNLKLRLDIERDLEIRIYDLESKQLNFQWNNIEVKELNLRQNIMLSVNSDGSMIALANSYGFTGHVLDLRERLLLFTFHRGTYHSENCVFPFAFFGFNGTTYLAHTTDWNQLDIVNPKTAEYVTNINRKLSHKDDQYLDYFFSELSVSPSQTKFLSNGWVWQPAGILAFLDVETCMNAKFGTERVIYSQLDDSWGWSTVWLSDSRIGIERFGGWDWSIPGFTILNTETGNIVDWFPGPEGRLFVNRDEYRLYSIKNNILSIWDLENGFLLYTYNIEFEPHHVVFVSSLNCFVFSREEKLYQLKIL